MILQERFKKLLAGSYTTFTSLDKELQSEMWALGWDQSDGRMKYSIGSEKFSGFRLANQGSKQWNRDLKIAMRKLADEQT